MAFEVFNDAMRHSVRTKNKQRSGRPMSERNLKILLDRMAGATFAELGKKYGVSGRRCCQICSANKQGAPYPEQPSQTTRDRQP